MRLATLAHHDDFDGWRELARALAAAEVPPDQIVWRVGDEAPDLLGVSAEPVGDANVPAFAVPRPFVALARSVVCHCDPERFALLYTMLLRLRATPALIHDQTDRLLRRLEGMAREVRQDIHKMRAFVRFRAIEVDDGGTHYVAWFEPTHHIVRTNATFFVDRFASMRWSILTPEVSLFWDGDALREGPGAVRGDAPGGDPVEEIWKAYYAAIFNPARVKIGAMLKEMPRRYWKNMPETALVTGLIASAQARESAMVATSRNDMAGNAGGSWAALREEARGCTRCPLHKHATQTVFGEGPLDAPILFVGEQPGDQEDLAGRPFVGPAGEVFDAALAEAGIDRARAYVTNAVKHFKYEQRGKRRIHAKPNAGEIQACRWWYAQERELIRPAITVALGATAARQMIGKVVTIAGARGQAHVLEDGAEGWVTVHPSYLLRLPDRDAAAVERERFVEDLRRVKARMAALGVG